MPTEALGSRGNDILILVLVLAFEDVLDEN
jgi:hypothetical protein